MSKFLKDLSVGDRVTIATFNIDNPMNIVGCEHDVQAIEGDTITFKNLQPTPATIYLKNTLDDGNSENYECMIDKWHYTGKPSGQYAGIFTSKDILISELQSIVKSNLEAKKKKEDSKS